MTTFLKLGVGFCVLGLLVGSSRLCFTDPGPKFDSTGNEAETATITNFKNPLGLFVDHDGVRAYVALSSGSSVAVVDLREGRIDREIVVGKGPRSLASVGNTLWVVCEHDDCVVEVDLKTHKVRSRFEVGKAPQDVCCENGDTLYVACHDAKTVERINLLTGERDSLKLKLHPASLAFGTWMMGKHVRPAVFVLSKGPGVARVNVLPSGKRQWRGTSWELPNATNPTRIVTLPCGKRNVSEPFVAYQIPKTNLAATQLIQGWVFSNALGSFTDSHRQAVPISLDRPTSGAADPTDLLVGSDKKSFFVTSGGTDQLLVVRRQAVLDRVRQAEARKPYGAADQADSPVSIDISQARLAIRKAIPTGRNPRRMAFSGDGKTLVVSNYLDDSLTVIDAPSLTVRKTISLGGKKPDSARRGEQLFHSARLTQFQQFSCASCHPGGHTDGLQWDLTRNGVGNPMNTRSLLGVGRTGPYGWHGETATLLDRSRGTLRLAHHYEPSRKELRDLVAYLRSLSVPRTRKVASKKAAVARGKTLFFGKAGCRRCHAGKTFQDGNVHDVGTARIQDTDAEFDTPSLLGVAASGPYLHDGRAESLIAIFTRYNSRKKHGRAHRLTKAELADLIDYVGSL
ncbi:MAG: cytochrome c peroxidase [Gemmataceae bacterium]